MGEMMADTLRDQTEIGKAAASENVFKTSISFGRFENDLLSWERWSSFSQNKYLEEVEKCATPGSVAEKKAYFEAHYKKIAARKAELDEEQKMGDGEWRSDSPTGGNRVSNGCSSKLEFDSVDCDGICDREGPKSTSTPAICRTHIDEAKEDVVGVSGQDSFGEIGKGEVHGILNCPKSNQIELNGLIEEQDQLRESLIRLEEMSVSVKEESPLREVQAQLEETPVLVKEENDSIALQTESEEVPVFVQEENQSVGSHDQLEESKNLDNGRIKPQMNRAKNAKVKLQQEPQKAKSQSTPPGTKKKPVTPPPKATRTSLPRAAKLSLATAVTPASRISARKDNTPSLPRNKSPSVVQSKRSTPNSLHMSLSLEPKSSDSATPTTIRRSFIMENMGDKEIVRRAFRTFQNNYNLSEPSHELKPSISQQVSAKATERVTSASVTRRKDNEGVKKVTVKANSQRGQVDGRWNSVSAGPIKAAGERQSSAKATTSTFGLRSDERPQNRNELLKKSEKSIAKEVERIRVQPTPKEKKEAEIKKLRQAPTKATSMPDKSRGQGGSRIHANKADAK